MKNIAQRQMSVCLFCIFLFSIVATGLVPADALASGDGCTITVGTCESVSDPTNCTVTCTGTCGNVRIGRADNTTNNATIIVETGATLSNVRIHVGTNGSITTAGNITSTTENTTNVFGTILLNTGSSATVTNGTISNTGTATGSVVRAAIQKVDNATGTHVTVTGGTLSGTAIFYPIYDKYTGAGGMDITITGGTLTSTHNSIVLNSSS